MPVPKAKATLTNPPLAGRLPARVVVQPAPDQVETLVSLATNRVTALESRRAYDRAVRDFLAWLALDGGSASLTGAESLGTAPTG